MALPKRIILLFIVGFVLGPLGDFFHVLTKTTGYPPNLFGLYIFGLPFWVFFLMGGASLAVGLAIPWLDTYLGPNKKRPGAQSGGLAVFGLFIFLGLYGLSGFLPGPAGGINDFIFAILAVLVWVFLDRTWQGIFLGILTAAAGVYTEITLVGLGAFFYHPDRANFFGVASWLPWLYFAASVTIGNFGRYLKFGGKGM